MLSYFLAVLALLIIVALYVTLNAWIHRRVVRENATNEQPIESLKRGEEEKPPDRRKGYVQKATVGGRTVYIHTGEFKDGRLAEIFLSMVRADPEVEKWANCFVLAVSLGLQGGVPLERFVEAFRNEKFSPSGAVLGNDRVQWATSVVDYVFQDLALSYANEGTASPSAEQEDLVQPSRESESQPKLFEEEPCSECGQQMLKRNDNGLACQNCGSTQL